MQDRKKLLEVLVFFERKSPHSPGPSGEWVRERLKWELGLRSVEIVKAPSGKPGLLDHSLAFSVSHTSTWNCVAILPESQKQSGFSLGLDLEDSARPTDCMKLAKRFFHPKEVAVLESLPSPHEIRREFFRLWTRKEAIVKCRGTALAQEISREEPSDLILQTQDFLRGNVLSVAVGLPLGWDPQATEVRVRQCVYWA